MNASLEISSGQYSIAGVKPQNEDACGIHIPDEPLLTTKGIAIAIADGMSTSDAGKQASEACVKGFLSDYFSTPESWTVKTSAQKVLSALNRWLHSQGQREYGHAQGMVTTFSSIVFKSNTAYLFHVGDTRIYRLKEEHLKQLTHDHRIVLENNKSYLNRAMGIDLRLDIDVRTVPVENNDIFLLISDGVYEYVSDDTIKNHIQTNLSDLNKACKAIVDTAVTNNSDDNLSCQLVQIKHLPGENEKEFYQKLTKLPFPPPLEQGMILDGYKISRQLFSNKRTEVYLATDTDTGEKVVLKAPSVNYDDDPEYINQFLHEEWAGRRINNPHVLKVLKINRKRHALYYITEYIEGQTLRQWMDDNPRPSLAVVRELCNQIAKGLRAFHRMEMIHQDLKPENILIDDTGTVKIIDFGSTKIAGIEEITTPLKTNNLLGTINYTAPEYHIGGSGSNRSDIFSLGVIGYELITGELPFTRELSARSLRHAKYRSIKHFVPEVPAWVDKAVEKAVSINPDIRFDKLSEFIYALSNPDSSLINQDYIPLIKRNPVKVWQGVSFLLLALNIILVYLLSL
ncbi:MAG: protein kinase [Gammaproteobacteria bacterium]|nr:protein kinase [Gammaproteobacteria bacterium]